MLIDESRPAAASPPILPGAARNAAQGRTILVILAMLAAGYALTVLVFQPGYATLDARYVYADAKTWNFGDWQSPLMIVLWRLVDPLAPGALGMFLLIATLYWLGFGLLAFTVARRAPWLGVITPVLALAPPAFVFVGMIWRDVLFGVVWLVAAVLPFAAAARNQGQRVPATVTIASLLLIATGVLLRPNAIFAGAILAIYALWPTRFEVRRAALVFIPAVLVCYALVPAVYYGLLHAKRQNPLHSLMVFDLGGITHFTGENQFPVAWSPAETALLTTTCYNAVRWDAYWYETPCSFVMDRLEKRPDDVIFGTPRLTAAWRTAILAHPLAYLQHRAAFMWNFLARPNLVLPTEEWDAPGVTYGRTPHLQPLLAVYEAIRQTVIFRPGLWLLLAIAIGAASWSVRATPGGAFALGVTTSAAVYVLTFFAVGVASDFRYAYWCVLAVLAGAVATLAARQGERVPAR